MAHDLNRSEMGNGKRRMNKGYGTHSPKMRSKMKEIRILFMYSFPHNLYTQDKFYWSRYARKNIPSNVNDHK